MKYEESLSPTPAAEVQEPATAYCTAGIGSAISHWEAEENDEDYDYGAPESVTVRTYAELCRKLLEGRSATMAGDTRPFGDAMRDFWRDVDNGRL